MSPTQELDPRVKGLERALKVGGTVLVAVAASGVVIMSAGSIIVAGIAAIGAIAVVNAVPVFARYVALKRQQTLTKLAEVFSAETIREDEEREGARIQEQQRLYQEQEAEFRNVIDELQLNMDGATDEERRLLQGQIDEMTRILQETFQALESKVADLVELRRVNGMYISLHKAAAAMQRGQDLQRNAAEIQRVATARAAIKTRMRAALAGQKLEVMAKPLQPKLKADGLAQMVSPLTNKSGLQLPGPALVTIDLPKEAIRVPNHQ